MSWIKIVSYQESQGKLRKLYDKVTGPNHNVQYHVNTSTQTSYNDRSYVIIQKCAALFQHTLPKRYLETLGVFVSMLNQCDYCVEHHYAELTRLLNDNNRAEGIKKALQNRMFLNVFSDKFVQGLMCMLKS